MSSIVGTSSTALVGLALAVLAYYGIRLSKSDCDLVLDSASNSLVKDKFKNKRVWVTGASSGIGRELALNLAQIPGVHLLLSARSEDVLLQVKQQVVSIGAKCDVLVVDLSDLPSLEEKVKQAKSLLGGDVDILVNNGGISQRGFAQDTSFDTDMKIWNVDFVACTVLTKALLRGWVARPNKLSDPKGLINISSVSGKFGVPLRTAYCSAKFALLGFMDALRVETAGRSENINITNVCPGSIQTGVSKNALMGNGEKFGVTDHNISKGMAVERCVELILRGFANDLPEIWMFISPKEKAATYVSQYFPALFKAFMNRTSSTLVKEYYESILSAKKDQ